MKPYRHEWACVVVRTRDIVSEVNGLPVASMQDLKVALDSVPDNYHRFTFISGREEALNVTDALAADAELLQQYNIPAPYRMEAVSHD